MKRSFSSSLLALTLVFFAVAPLASANLITNGGFETGTFSGWTTTPAASGSNFGVSATAAHSGAFGASFGGTSFDSISQTFATTAGAFYDLSFFYQIAQPNPHGADLISGPGVADNEFRVLFNGIVVFDNINANPGFGSFNFNSLLATGGATTLEFQVRNTVGFDFLDDVSVNGSIGSVPDTGSTVALLGISLLGLILAQRSVRRENA